MAKGLVLDRRSYTLEVRSVTESKNSKNEEVIVVEGHAALFDVASDAGGLSWFTEVIRRGAFTKAILEDDVRALFNHDSNLVLGRNKSGTLTLTEDEKGLAIRIEMPNTQTARDLAVLMRRGDINQMSFSFLPRTKDGEKWTEQGDKYTRELIELKLYDVSIVTYPFYEETDASVRGNMHEDRKKEFEDKKKDKTQNDIREANRRRDLELKSKEVRL